MKNSKKSFILLLTVCVLSLGPAAAAGAVPQEIELLLDKGEYYQTVLTCIQNAQESIYLKLYLFTESTLAQALKDARCRGVQVKVILDRACENDSKNAKNYKLLQQAGIDIQYDPIGILTHNKLLIIDKEIIILGSTNWTATSLFLNNEVAVLIKSKYLARGLLVDATPAENNISLLDENSYISACLKHLTAAKKSITIVSYRFKYSADPQDDLARIFQTLLAARQRGVAISLVLDQQFRSYLGYLGGRETSAVTANFAVAAQLDQRGLTPDFDSVARITHAKLIVIDGEISIFGSQDWTGYPAARHDQDSVLIHSPSIAVELESFAAGIQRQPPIIPLKPCPPAVGIRIPYSFLIREDPQNPGQFLDGTAAQLLHRGSKRYLDLYLRLLLEYQPGQPIKVDYQKLASVLGYRRSHLKDKTGKYYRSYYKQHLSRLLKKLVELSLITYDQQQGEVYLARYTIPEEKYFILPREFFTFGWDRKLSLKAQYLYLINLLEESLDPQRPWWSRSYQGISQMYRLSMNTVWEALSELQRQNIVEVYRDAWEPDQPFSAREKNKYFLNPLPDPRVLQAVWKTLQQIYGKDLLRIARRLAVQLDEPNDPWVVEAFIGLILRYGKENVIRANAKTAGFRRSYSKRHIGYTMGILEETEKGS